MISKIISGGQTGVDRAALDAAMNMGFPCGGYCTKGRKSEDGVIPDKYPLIELTSDAYKERTKKNVLESDFTLIICDSALSKGALLTKKLCIDNSRVFEVVYAKKFSGTHGFRGFMQYEHAVKDLLYEFLYQRGNGDLVLNVAGTRLSQWHEGYNFTYHLIKAIIREIT